MADEYYSAPDYRCPPGCYCEDWHDTVCDCPECTYEPTYAGQPVETLDVAGELL